MTDAELLLRDLGAQRPEEIDLELIAHHQGLTIKYRQLEGCEARIIGAGGRGVISVDDRNGASRVRFSIAHELGHWQRHRGRSLTCRADDIGNPRKSPMNPERVADTYAADLLMPGYMFDERAAALGFIGVEPVRELAGDFRTSLTSTAIRMVERGPEYAFLICHGPRGRKWFRRHRAIDEKWFPKRNLDPDSFAHDLLNGCAVQTGRELMDAEAWFDRDEASDYEIWEDSIKIADDEILSFVVVRDEDMLG